MSRTLHHRKTAEERRGRKRYIPQGRANASVRTAMALGDADIPTRERTAARRTR